tara:strand:+ start:1318 stop:1605 length:288 start_codon:yes stop_codon:yes gene_type:complete
MPQGKQHASQEIVTRRSQPRSQPYQWFSDLHIQAGPPKFGRLSQRSYAVGGDPKERLFICPTTVVRPFYSILTMNHLERQAQILAAMDIHNASQH